MQIDNNINIYGNKDPRKMPTYIISEASRYLHLSPSTLRTWIKGRSYIYQDINSFSKPIISQPGNNTSLLSFEHLIEAHIIKALRTIHRVSMRNLKIALDTAEKKFGITNLLLSPFLKAGAGQLFLDEYGALINLSRSGQYAMKRILEAHLERVEYDSVNLPSRFYPFLIATAADNRKVIVIDPTISFGKPVIVKKFISTSVIVNRIDAGEDIKNVADDYDLDTQDINDAILYERAA
jgi:uncharacterized protein (DUF433 family)